MRLASDCTFARHLRNLLMQRLLHVVLILAMLLSGLPASAQDATADDPKTGLIKGRLVAQATAQPATDVQLTIPRLKLLVNSDAEGNFSFSRVPYGTHTIILGGQTVKADTLSVDVHDAVADLGDLTVTLNEGAALPLSTQIPVIALEENTLSADDEGVRVSNVSGLLSASRDPFISAVAFVFGPYRFQPRGYNRTTQEVQINGTPMNDVETGEAFWSQWGGLNDVFRSRSNTYGLQPSEYAFGGINGSVYFDAAAASQQKQTRVTYSVSNRSWRNRLMLTHSSGLLKSGWAYSVSLSKRWAKEGYIPGTFYDGYSYYAGISKRLSGGKHELNLFTFGAPTRRGKMAPAQQEAYDIAGTNYYNPNWGYQNGEKRNARVANTFQPTTVLNYVYAPSNTLRWNTSASYQSGKSKNSLLDWFNADNPRPDYYRYLPSFHIIEGMDPSTARFYQQQQIDWDGLYNANYANIETISNVNGDSTRAVTGRRSRYVIGNDVDDVKKFTFNTIIEKVLGEHLTLEGGLQYINQRTETYKEIDDLLGGQFYVNFNQFAVQQTPPYNQYDLNNPNSLVYEGDRYGYNYISRFSRAFLWGQAVAHYNKVDLFLALRGGMNTFSREGLYRNGLFADNSFGKSDVQSFTTFSAKGGITYKLDGRNYLFVNGMIGQEAPTFENTFISPRTRNAAISNPATEKISSIEGGYLMRTPKYNVRVVGYATDIKDQAEIKRYYSEASGLENFINYVMQGVNTRHTGLELAGEVKVSPVLSVGAVASIAQAFYTSNPKSVNIFLDNDTNGAAVSREIFIKNYYLATGPQTAYTAGLRYGPWRYFYGNINFNYFDNNYVDISPDQRSVDAVEGVPVGSRLYQSILDQEKLPSAFTIDVSLSKSVLLSKLSKGLPRNTFLYFNVGISNLLDRKDIRTGGFEQLRYDFSEREPDKFATKYFYSFGRNFFINISLKF